MVDWQFTCASSPYLDVSAMAFLNQSPEDIQANSKLFLKEYFDTFNKICSNMKIQMPWTSFDEFEKNTIERGYISLFVWLIISFSPVVYSTKIMDRFVFILKKAMSLNPNFFE